MFGNTPRLYLFYEGGAKAYRPCLLRCLFIFDNNGIILDCLQYIRALLDQVGHRLGVTHVTLPHRFFICAQRNRTFITQTTHTYLIETHRIVIQGCRGWSYY